MQYKLPKISERCITWTPARYFELFLGIKDWLLAAQTGMGFTICLIPNIGDIMIGNSVWIESVKD